MSIKPEFLVRGLDGRPVPPADLLAKLHQYDPRIGLFYTNAAWAITEAWREDDQRRQWIQDGSMQPEMAFDICGYLPITCSLDEAPAYIAKELRNWEPGTFEGLRNAVNNWNTAQQDAVMEDVVLGAVSNDLDKGNIVTPGTSVAVASDIAPAKKEPIVPLPPLSVASGGSGSRKRWR